MTFLKQVSINFKLDDLWQKPIYLKFYSAHPLLTGTSMIVWAIRTDYWTSKEIWCLLDSIINPITVKNECFAQHNRNKYFFQKEYVLPKYFWQIHFNIRPSCFIFNLTVSNKMGRNWYLNVKTPPWIENIQALIQLHQFMSTMQLQLVLDLFHKIKCSCRQSNWKTQLKLINEQRDLMKICIRCMIHWVQNFSHTKM